MDKEQITRLHRLALIRQAERELRDQADEENLERLRWELDRAMTNLLEALERRCNRTAGPGFDDLYFGKIR